MCYNYYSDNMIETLEKIFEFKKTIKNKTSIIIDAFSAFYGEKYKTLIKEKITNVPISIKFSQESLNDIILEVKTKQLLEYVYKIDNEELKKKINKSVIKKSFETGRFKIIEFENLKHSIDEDNKIISTYYEKVKREFNSIKTDYKEINEIVRIYEYTNEQLVLKYRTEYQNKVKDLLLNHTKISVNSIINNLDLFVEKDFNDVPIVHLVHEKDNKKILSIFENDMLFPQKMVMQGINNIKKEYFDKLSGKDLSLEEYYTSPEYKAYVLDDKILKSLELIRKKIIIKYNRSLIEIFDFLTNKKEVTEEFYQLYNYSRSSQTNWRPYKKDNNNLLELFTIIYFDDLKSLMNIDATIIHELNHIFELKQLSDNEFVIGWDSFKYDYEKNEMVDLNKGKYTYINEGINELISLDIVKIIHENDYLFTDKENSIDKNSMYNKYEFLLKEFYEEYKDTIIESRLAGNINIIIDRVGKNNFNDLNNLVNDFNKYFSDSKPLKMFEEKKNAILEKMRERKVLK